MEKKTNVVYSITKPCICHMHIISNVGLTGNDKNWGIGNDSIKDVLGHSYVFYQYVTMQWGAAFVVVLHV